MKIPSDDSLRMKLQWRYLLAGISAILYFLAFVGFDQWYLAWICLVPLFFAFEGASTRQSFFIGWFFGSVTLTGGFYWVAHTIHVFAFMPWIVSGIGCLLLSVAQGTQFAAFGCIYAWLKRRTGLGPLIIGTAAFIVAEFVCPQLFPHYFGASQYLEIPLIQISDITGVMGVTAILVFTNISIYIMIRGALIDRCFKWKPVLISLGLLCAVLAYGYLRLSSVDASMAAAPKLRFGIAQPNLGLREKSLNPKKAIRVNQEMTSVLKGQGADIVIWPETAVQRPVVAHDDTKLTDEIVGDLRIPILTGIIEKDFGRRDSPFFNTAMLVDEEGNILGRYRKQKLLAFGEYIPMGESFPKLYRWFPYISRFGPGDSNEPIKFGDYHMSVSICYEGILPRLVSRMMVYSPDVLINITNDNWFGRTHEPMQHLILAAFRSIEHRRWMVRSTNTGISAFVDAAGRIVERSPLMEPATLIHDVPMMKGKTIYAACGDWLGWLSILFVAICSITGLRRKGGLG